MKTRLLCLGLLAAASQLFTTGCHPVQRFRANHPYIATGPLASPEAHPLLHPLQTRRAVIGEPVGFGGPGVGPMVPACHGCGTPGAPVGFSGVPFEGVPITPTGYPPTGYPPIGYPSIGYPKPITPGPVVVPQYELPMPMPVKP